MLETETSRVVKVALELVHVDDTFEVLAVLKDTSTIGSLPASRRILKEEITMMNRIYARELQTASTGLKVSLQLVLWTRSPTTFTTEIMQKSIGTAFDTPDKQTAFIVALQQKDTTFNRINAVEVSIDDKQVIVIQDGSAAWIYISAGIGSATVAILSLLLLLGYRRRRSNQVPFPDGDATTIDAPPRGPIQSFEFDTEDQDISTIGNPEVGGQSSMFVGHFGLDDSRETGVNLVTEYDFGLAYGGAGDIPSISSAGGTKSTPATPVLGDVLDKNRRERTDSEEVSKVSSVKEDLSLFQEDDSFDHMYGEDERIDVIAPAGKLGVVIDTPMNGPPIVHAIKETSVLVDRVRIGDKLVAVDGEDTTELSAIRVSKLISSKAANDQRHMVFMRSQN